MPILFHQTQVLTAQIDDYLDALSEGVLVFQQAVSDYVRGKDDRFQERVTSVGELENRCDDLRRAIERHLYSQSLIPESRGDVLGLLETLDDVINTGKATLLSMDVERHEILAGTESDWEDLAATAASTAESVVLAARAFFRNPHAVSDHLHKVYFHEKEGDRVAESLKRKIFAADIDLARKTHLRDCARGIDNVSDAAEDVADRLSIYAIKRTV
jgi:uncharacterized protein